MPEAFTVVGVQLIQLVRKLAHLLFKVILLLQILANQLFDFLDSPHCRLHHKRHYVPNPILEGEPVESRLLKLAVDWMLLKFCYAFVKLIMLLLEA